MMYKINYATGSRADYGIVRNYLSLLETRIDVDLSLLVTGTHLEETYGMTKDLIENDGHKIDLEVPLDLSNNPLVTSSVAKVTECFGKYFEKNKPDLLIILGDRYEMLGVAIAAALNKIQILHLHGGEATFGNYDEFIRHAITKMSMFHIVATERYRQRVIQLGEEPARVYNLGALGAENCTYINMKNVMPPLTELVPKSYFVILFHPETLTEASVEEQTKVLLSAITRFQDNKFIFLGSNADTNAYKIRSIIKQYIENNRNAIYFENLNPDSYHYIVKNAICLVGNSSSGIIEAPSLNTYTINIGARQDGREQGNSIINVKCEKGDIIEGIKKIISNDMPIKISNPYQTVNTARRYFDVTMRILKEARTLCVKEFHDLSV